MIFNFSGLHSVFIEAIHRHEPTIAFPLINGRGRFVFLLFIPSDKAGKIKWDKIELFIILGRTQRVLPFDLTGNHLHKGVFNIATRSADEQAFRAELGIENADRGNFSLSDFLAQLNNMIPTSISLEDKISCIQENREQVRMHCGRHINSATRVHLLRPQPVALPKKPREETLRKLYMLEEDKKAISRLIEKLKERNWTVAWTDVKPDGVKFLEIWQKAFS